MKNTLFAAAFAACATFASTSFAYDPVCSAFSAPDTAVFILPFGEVVADVITAPAETNAYTLATYLNNAAHDFTANTATNKGYRLYHVVDGGWSEIVDGVIGGPYVKVFRVPCGE